MSIKPKRLLLCFIAAILVSPVACTQGKRVPHRTDTLVLAAESSPTDLDPRIGIDKASENFCHLLYNGLLKKDEHDRMIPDLADSWEKVTPLLYRFHLRKGVRFHDGTLLDAADVVFTFNTILNGTVHTSKKAALESVVSVTAVSADVVEIHLREPFNGLLVNLTLGIIPDRTDVSFAERPVGTGPYRMLEFERDSGATLEAFRDYFEGVPKVRFLQIKIIPDATTRALEMKKGSIDLILGTGGVPPDYLQVLASDPELRVVTRPGNNYYYVGINLRDPLLADRKVRRAIGAAINRPSIIRSLFHGEAVPATGILAPHHWSYEPNVLRVSYDPNSASRLLDQAGYPDRDGDGPGTRFDLTLKLTTIEFRRTVAAAVQSDLKAVGIGLNIRSYEWATFFSDINRGNFQLCMLMWVGESDPDILRNVFSTNGSRNRGKYSDPKVDEWVQKAKTAPTEELQRQYYSLVQKQVAEDCPYISLWYESTFAVMRKELQGMQLTPDSDWRVLKDVHW